MAGFGLRESAVSVRFDGELIGKYGGPGPRYTSYPTAVQFHEGFTPARHRLALEHSNASGRPLSLYAHIPFCHSLCYYCGCTKIVTRKRDRAESYLRTLLAEMALYDGLVEREREVQQLHLGGGTPTYLDAAQLERLMQGFDRHFGLSTAAHREYSIEVDPRTASTGDPARWADLGFNRLSFGVQDFDARVQQAVNRIQSFGDTEALVTAARDAGFGSLSLDLIYGLPHQSVASFSTTLDRVLAIRPERLAVYSYAHMPQLFKAQRMIDQASVPAAPERLALMELTIRRLGDAGYEFVGMDHFALPDDELVRARNDGTLQRNFQGYSTCARSHVIALGMSAISDLGSAYSQNHKDLKVYEQAVSAGCMPVSRGVELSQDDRLRRAVIRELMCHGRLELGDELDGIAVNMREYFAAELEALTHLEADGLLELDGNAVRATDRGQLLLRSIAMTFDRYTAARADTARHSRVI
jgi:oxygen-independent coproporphyrinogen-3 oxidase